MMVAVMRPRILLPALLLLAFLPAEAGGLEVRFDEKADFDSYSTFTWLQGKPAARQSAQDVIEATLVDELAREGLSLVEHDADLYVAVWVIPGKHSLRELDDPVAWDYWTGVQTTDALDVGEGTLIVDLIDGESDQLVWRALSSGSVKGNVKRIKRRLPGKVAHMFDSYPPPTR
jgi:hypothetical protein